MEVDGRDIDIWQHVKQPKYSCVGDQGFAVPLGCFTWKLLQRTVSKIWAQNVSLHDEHKRKNNAAQAAQANCHSTIFHQKIFCVFPQQDNSDMYLMSETFSRYKLLCKPHQVLILVWGSVRLITEAAAHRLLPVAHRFRCLLALATDKVQWQGRTPGFGIPWQRISSLETGVSEINYCGFWIMQNINYKSQLNNSTHQSFLSITFSLFCAAVDATRLKHDRSFHRFFLPFVDDEALNIWYYGQFTQGSVPANPTQHPTAVPVTGRFQQLFSQQLIAALDRPQRSYKTTECHSSHEGSHVLRDFKQSRLKVWTDVFFPPATHFLFFQPISSAIQMAFCPMKLMWTAQKTTTSI